MFRLFAVVAFVVGLSLAGGARAQEGPSAEKLALSERFIAALQTDQMSEMMGQMMTGFMQPQPGLTADEQAALERAMLSTTRTMMPRMFKAMAPVYADIFTLEELKALVDFYEGPLGRSMIEKSYAAGPRVAAAMMEIMPELLHDMADNMCRELECTPEERAQMDAALAQSRYGQQQ